MSRILLSGPLQLHSQEAASPPIRMGMVCVTPLRVSAVLGKVKTGRKETCQ